MAEIAFLGTPEAAVTSLEGLVAAGHQVNLVVSQPDRRRARRGSPAASPVKAAALDMGLRVSDRVEDVLACGADIGVVVAFGRLIPGSILDALSMLNVHFSLLPRWRGAAPVERAILAGDEVTGVSIMRLDEGLDTGPVLARRAVEIAPCETAADLTRRLACVGRDLLVEVLANGVPGLPAGIAQEGEATYAKKLAPEELRIDWQRPAEEILRLVRLGRAWTTLGAKRLIVTGAAVEPPGVAGDPDLTPDTVPDAVPGVGPGAEPGCLGADGVVVTGQGRVRLLTLKPEGRPEMEVSAWMRGLGSKPSIRLGS